MVRENDDNEEWSTPQMSDTEATATELLARIHGLESELARLKNQQKFGLVWEDTPDAQVQRACCEVPLLREDTSRAVMTDEAGVDHVLVSGDNFHALTALRVTHAGSVDMVYIDPPYNTGNKDFIYNDSYLDKDDQYAHSKWLSFMEYRLRLARDLLTEDGIIFVSIDDHEHARLKLLMDEIFGTKNFLSTLVWDKKNTKNDAANFQKNHEYVLVYGRSSKTRVFRNVVERRKVIPDSKGFYIREGLTMGGGRGGTLNGRPNLGYTLYYHPLSGDIKPIRDQDIEAARVSNDPNVVYRTRTDLVDQGYVPVRPRPNGDKLGCWKWGFEKMEADLFKVFFTPAAHGFTAAYKRYQDSEKVIEQNGAYWLTHTVHRNVRSVVDFANGEGARTLKKIFGSKPFDHPKNVDMIKYFVEILQNPNAVVLDFFAGSGTTAHAVAELNAQDGGTRQCILVTDSGQTEESSRQADGSPVHIAEDITYERVRRVLTGEDWADGKPHEPLGGNLRYFTVDMVSMDHPDAANPSGLILAPLSGD